MWYNIKDLATLLKVSEKTVRRRLKKGEWETKEVDAPHGGSKIVMISFGRLDTVGQSERLDTVGHGWTRLDTEMSNPSPESTPSAESAMSTPINSTVNNESPTNNEQIPGKVIKHPPTAPGADQAAPVPFTDHRSPITDHGERSELPPEADQIARLRLTVVKCALNLTAENSKTQAYNKTVTLYNNGLLAPELRETQPTLSTRTIQRWIRQYQFSRDYHDLVPQNKIKDSGAISITEDEEKILLRLFLNQNKPSKGSCINLLKISAQSGQINSPTSERTLRRWLDRYENEHKDVVIFARQGQKALVDKLLPYIERDWSLLNVHDLWTLDGNILNFLIVYPPTGKAMRMMFVPVMEMRTRAIIGASLGPTENTFNVARAIRAALLNTGIIPRAILMDNGKANRSKYFAGKDLEKELSGLFSRLGTQEVYAKPYNGRAKPIERWFRTFNENFERFLEPYIGASIADKPARLMRNEKWHQKLIDKEALTIQEAYQFIAAYVHQYNNTPHSALDGKTPAQALAEANPFPPERQITESQLIHLMMKRKALKVGNNGVHLLHAHYYEPHLTSHVGELVNVRYDFDCLDHVYVYTPRGKFICRAPKVIGTHPLTAIANSPESEEELKRQIKRNAKLAKNARKALEGLSETFQQADELIARSLPTPGNAKPQLGTFTDHKSLPTPKPQKNTDSTIADLLDSTSNDKRLTNNDKTINFKEDLGI